MRRWWSIVLYAAAALSLIAAMIHAWIMPKHFEEWWGYGTFFLALALVQGFYSVVLLRWPKQPIFLLGITVNLAIIVLYVVTRTFGVPFFGPLAGMAEEMRTLDLVSKVAEGALIIALAVLVRAWSSHKRSCGAA